jgi:sarcosine oxidase
VDARVGVIGVGTMGSMALWHLARRGVSAIGFEQFGAGHDRGAAGGETKIFRTAYLEGREYVPLLQAAYRQWRDLEREMGSPLLTMTGGLSIGDADAPFMQEILRSIEAFDLDHEILDAQTARQRYQQHRLLDGEAMIVDRQAGFLRAGPAVLAAILRAEKLGATVHRRTRVESVEPLDDDGVRIRAGGRDFTVEKAIISAGPWAASLLPRWERCLTVERLVMTWYVAREPLEFAPEHFPVFVRRSRGVELFGIPTVDQRTVKVALVSGYGEVYDPDALDLRVEVEDLREIDGAVRELLPGLIPEPLRVNAYMDAYTPDGHPFVGTHPEMPNTIVLCGFSGHGFKMSPVIGDIAADLALDGETRYQIGHLTPERETLLPSEG